MRVFYLVTFLILTFAGCGGPITTNSDSKPVNAASPASQSTSASQTVNITSPDGVILVGTFLESAKPNSPAVLLLHQWQSDRHSYDDFAKRMHAKEFKVLAIDGRGFGESIKKCHGTDVKAMLGDVGAAFEFLSKQKNVDPNRIGIVGASYGSSLAIIYAADNPNVKAVALLSPGLNYFGNMQTQPAVAKYGNRPLMLVAAQDDSESEDAVKKLNGGSNDMYHPVKVYDKGGHGTALFHAPVSLEASLEEFVSMSLAATK